MLVIGSWLFYPKSTATGEDERLKMWLERNKPSQMRSSDGIRWVGVVDVTRRLLEDTKGPLEEPEGTLNDTGGHLEEIEDEEGEIVEAEKDWESFEGEKNMETINRIAEKYNVTSGKWMCRVSSDIVDRYWAKLVIAAMSGQLGPSVRCLKVSTVVDDEDETDGFHVICVYTPFIDTVQLMRVENLIRLAGIVSELKYKPDIFTHLGIYRGNKWGFKPSIFSSKFMPLERKSQIRIVGSENSYFNSREGFENPEDLDFDKITAQISASIKKNKLAR